MDIHTANEAKASFDHIYTQPTPHDYCSHLSRLDYSICDETRPFCAATATLLDAWEGRVRMLDVGCSYGINAAAVKHGILFAELARFFEANVPLDLDAAVARVGHALSTSEPAIDMECGGLDVSAPAICFARRAGLLEHGIVADLESGKDELSAADRDWVSGVNLILATGAIGYVTERTLEALLAAIGDRAPHAVVLLTVLRVFDPTPIADRLSHHGLETVTVPRVLLPQRRFHDSAEQRDIVRVIEEKGLDPAPERSGRHFAKLLVAARPDRTASLQSAFAEVASGRLTLKPEPSLVPEKSAESR